MNGYTRPRSWVFAIEVDGVPQYWTGCLNEHGKLERSPFRADAYKFRESYAALCCAETHEELRDSTEWRLVPLTETPIRKLETAR